MENYLDYLVTKKVTGDFSKFSEVFSLYETAFPPNEKVPVQDLINKATNGNIKFTAYYDDDIFVGFSYVIIFEKICFVLFLATNPQIRSKGYGSRILKMIQKENEDKQIALNVEKLDSKASNNEQRKKRMEFYIRNGFKDSGYLLFISSFPYTVLTTAEELDIEQYIQTMKSLANSKDAFEKMEEKPEAYKRIN